jgi:hypothetical protein
MLYDIGIDAAVNQRYLSRKINSILLFWAIPAAVLLDATGVEEP